MFAIHLRFFTARPQAPSRKRRTHNLFPASINSCATDISGSIELGGEGCARSGLPVNVHKTAKPEPPCRVSAFRQKTFLWVDRLAAVLLTEVSAVQNSLPYHADTGTETLKYRFLKFIADFALVGAVATVDATIVTKW
jgi:hypothetical protein